MPFDGETYDRDLDGVRLGRQLRLVKDIMSDYQRHTLGELMEKTGERSESAVSARVRDLRKPKFGGHRIRSRRVAGGLWVYQMLPPERENPFLRKVEE